MLYVLGVSMSAEKDRLLAEYDTLTVERERVNEKLKAIDTRRNELRDILFGEPKPQTPEETPNKKTRRQRRPLSVWERLKRTPPPALVSVVELVRERGQVRNQDVAEALNLSIEKASLRLSRAVRLNFLRRVAHGLYEIEPLSSMVG
jgi:hypothetical protein